MAADNPALPKTAMVLAAGLGTRMRNLTETQPKPLVKVLGKALIDHVIDRLAQAGVETAAVNVHHFADALEAHLKDRTHPRIVLSDERAGLLGTGGGIARALRLIGAGPFFIVNADSIWLEGVVPNLVRLARAFDEARMDALLLVAATANSLGYEGRGDFNLDAEGRLQSRAEQQMAPFVYTGAALLSPRLFADAPAGAFPLTRLFQTAEQAGRLHGLRLEGTFLHVGTPEAVAAAEQAIRRATA
ncbi:MAG TPA: nucleotidyltransferase family protein [Xanthobacteraceae bacterium]|nr:nucleotidyltransferase family protein [Xanthobacteraceae bacterium]